MIHYLVGIKAGASPEAYNVVFADFAVQRQDLEGRYALVNSMLASVSERKEASQQRISKAVQQALEDAWRVLSSPDVAGVTKRDILLTLADKVILHKDGVEVVFAPGLFDEAESDDARSNCHTTCTVCRDERIVKTIKWAAGTGPARRRP